MTGRGAAATAQRRIGAKDSATRAKLLDAAEQLMREEGYAAVTSRRIGKQAGIASQLVHYYFRTMDDLFLEVIRRRSEAGLAAFAELLEGDLSLGALWQFQANQPGGQLTTEFTALARHRPAVRAEIAKYGVRFRELHTAAVARVLARDGSSPEVWPPEVLTLVMTGVVQLLAQEQAIGIDAGHEDTKAFIEQLIARLEGEGIEGLSFARSESGGDARR